MKTIIKHQISLTACLVISMTLLANLAPTNANALSKNIATDTIRSVTKSSNVSVYHNPVTDILNIEAWGEKEAHVFICNSSGTPLSAVAFTKEGEKQALQYNFENEASGTYFVKVSQGDRLTIVRVVKQ